MRNSLSVPPRDSRRRWHIVVCAQADLCLIIKGSINELATQVSPPGDVSSPLGIHSITFVARLPIKSELDQLDLSLTIVCP